MPKHTPDIFVHGGICLPVTLANAEHQEILSICELHGGSLSRDIFTTSQNLFLVLHIGKMNTATCMYQ